MALVDVPSQPLLADVVDFRCLAGYGVAFSIADVAGCVGFIVGPLLGGYIASCTAAVGQEHAGVPSSALPPTTGTAGAQVRVDVERACAIFGAVALLVAPVIVVGVSRAENSTSASARDNDGCGEREGGADAQDDPARPLLLHHDHDAQIQ